MSPLLVLSLELCLGVTGFDEEPVWVGDVALGVSMLMKLERFGDASGTLRLSSVYGTRYSSASRVLVVA